VTLLCIPKQGLVGSIVPFHPSQPYPPSAQVSTWGNTGQKGAGKAVLPGRLVGPYSCVSLASPYIALRGYSAQAAASVTTCCSYRLVYRHISCSSDCFSIETITTELLPVITRIACRNWLVRFPNCWYWEELSVACRTLYQRNMGLEPSNWVGSRDPVEAQMTSRFMPASAFVVTRRRVLSLHREEPRLPPSQDGLLETQLVVTRPKSRSKPFF
jgi:hypothetical protein